MSGFTLAPGRPTLADRVIDQGLGTDIVLICAGAALTSIAAQFTIPLWPIPLTGQTFAVLVIGSSLGALRGALSLALYLLLGSFGLPVFGGGMSGNIFTIDTGGFIVGFVCAAALTGGLAQRGWDRRVVGTIISFAAGTIVIYLCGLPWLYAELMTYTPSALKHLFGTTDVFRATIKVGLLPFIVGDTLKALLAAAVLPFSWRLVQRHDLQRERARSALY